MRAFLVPRQGKVGRKGSWQREGVLKIKDCCFRGYFISFIESVGDFLIMILLGFGLGTSAVVEKKLVQWISAVSKDVHQYLRKAWAHGPTFAAALTAFLLSNEEIFWSLATKQRVW
jgi:hypothetical protein